jgi:hypothetical protein
VPLALLGQLILLQCDGASACDALVIGSPDRSRGETTADPQAEQVTKGRMITVPTGELFALGNRAGGR